MKATPLLLLLSLTAFGADDFPTQLISGQGDPSIWGNLLFFSVEDTRGRIDCGTQGVADTVSAERFRGIRIFDISNLDNYGDDPRWTALAACVRGFLGDGICFSSG